MSEQCEGCLGYKDDDEKFAVLCEECQEKAASYDITARERNDLAKTIKAVLPKFKPDMTRYEIGEITGRLRTLLLSCRFVIEEEVEVAANDT